MERGMWWGTLWVQRTTACWQAAGKWRPQSCSYQALGSAVDRMTSQEDSVHQRSTQPVDKPTPALWQLNRESLCSVPDLLTKEMWAGEFLLFQATKVVAIFYQIVEEGCIAPQLLMGKRKKTQTLHLNQPIPIPARFYKWRQKAEGSLRMGRSNSPGEVSGFHCSQASLEYRGICIII